MSLLKDADNTDPKCAANVADPLEHLKNCYEKAENEAICAGYKKQNFHLAGPNQVDNIGILRYDQVGLPLTPKLPQQVKSQIAMVAMYCPKTLDYCNNECVERCQSMLKGDCEGPECGCGWRCPGWIAPGVRCEVLTTLSEQNPCSKVSLPRHLTMCC